MTDLVFVGGDTHGNLHHFRYLLDMAVEQGCKKIVQVGDFGYWDAPFHDRFSKAVNKAAMQAGVTVYWLDGNHENHDSLEKEVDVTADVPQQMLANLWYLPRGCTWTWDGCRFMALGGAYSIDKHHRIHGVSWWPQETITQVQIDRARDRGVVDVMFTHDMPEECWDLTVMGNYKSDGASRNNRQAVSEVVKAIQPRLLVHGHYHYRYSMKVEDLNDLKVEGVGCDGMHKDSWIVINPADWAPQ